jgi:phospholipid/cholesterol/gamma-HCH transport system substrate-binding protein
MKSDFAMKKINLEMVVGLFILAGFLCFGYLSLQLGEVSVLGEDKYYALIADFDNVSGLKEGAVMEIAGVNIGKVTRVMLSEADRARVYMRIPKTVAISADAVASVRTQGIIGDKYIRIIQGGSDEVLHDGNFITETEAAIDIEEMVSKYIFGDV